MGVINIAELKARFATGDQPTQKDYIDLIDTLLVAGAGDLAPAGPAGGALAGTYPNPTLHTDAVNANRPITRDSIQDGEVTLEKLNRVGSVTNAVPTRTVAGVEWLVPGTSLETTPNVSGAIVHFSSALLDLPNAEGVITADAPTNFGTASPQMVNVVAVFLDSFAGYAAGDEVPIDHFTLADATDVRAFTISNYENAGVRRFAIRCEYGTFGVGTGLAVWGKTDVDAPPSSAALYAFEALATAQATIQLRVYASRYENGTGFGSLTAYQPNSENIPADGSTVTFSHNFGAMPSMEPRVSLICAAADANYAVGDIVPAHLAFAINGGDGDLLNPAFAVLVGTNDIVIRRKAATIKIPDNTTGALATMDAAKWKITVEAHRVLSVPTLIFPATSWEVGNPASAISYGDEIYFFNKDQGSDHKYLSKINTTNNNLAFVADFGVTSRWNFIPTIIRYPGTTDDYLVWCDNTGMHHMNLATGVITSLKTGVDLGSRRVVDAAASGTPNRPHFLLLVDSYESSNANITQHVGYRMTYSGGAYTYSTLGNINWKTASAAFTNGSPNNFTRYHPSNDNILAVNYNRIKNRLYLTTDSNGAIYVLKLNSGTLYSTWPANNSSSLRHTTFGANITLQKIVMFGACPSVWSDTSCEKFNLEYNLDTGEEIATTINRRGHTSLTGAINRFPWVE